MEKKKPTHDLRRLQKTFSTLPQLCMTTTAIKTATDLGFSTADVLDIQSMKQEHFYKSMTANHDHKQWQDVYHVPSSEGLLYVKFTTDVVSEFILLSFKEKDNA